MNKHAVNILLIVFLGLAVYSNTFNVPFQFDDINNIPENAVIKDLNNFAHPFSSNQELFNARYISYLTFALNYKMHGLDVTGYHVFNLMIHLINAVLVYCLVILTLKTPVINRIVDYKFHTNLIALFSALLFVAHPLQTQAVTYIVQRLASLAAMFYLLSLVMYVKFRIQNTEHGTQNSEYTARKAEAGSQKKDEKSSNLSSVIWYLGSVFSAILAMKTKSIAFTLPVMAGLYEFIFFEGKIRKRLLMLVPLLLTMLIIPLSLIDINKPVGEVIGDVGGVTKLETQLSRMDYFYTQCRVIVTYIRLIFLPVNQNLLYDYPVYNSFSEPDVFLSFLFLLSVLGLGIYLCYRPAFSVQRSATNTGFKTPNSQPHYSRFIAFGIFWFFVTLSVESSIIPILHVIFEHRVYLASAGAFIAITTSVFVAADKLKDKFPRIKAAVVPVFVFIIVILSASTYARNSVWKDGVTLWKDVVEKSPHHEIALTNLGDAYIEKGQPDNAVYYLSKAVAVRPDYAKAHYNLGVAYVQKVEFDRALRYFLKAVDIRPDYGKAYNNIGTIYLRKGELSKAVEYFEKAVSADPGNAAAFYNFGIAYSKLGQADKAIEYFEMAVAKDPGYDKAYYNLGYLYRYTGRIDKAILSFNRAIEIRPDYAQAHYQLGDAYAEKGKHDRAAFHYEKAKEIEAAINVKRR
ncbi:MAG: tetratricopeptide repeat protein [Nitrospirae bacterium]|nr:tetratricopeptide repeat protein [Nitrospirota bacterium]